MFYFNEKKYNFWEIYNCIHKFYPVGSIPAEMDSFYNSYPGIIEKKKIIADGIYDNDVFKKKWSDFNEDISHKTGQKITGTTSGITSSYSAQIELKRTILIDLTRTKELHFFVSLLGPFYTIIGMDKNEVAVEDKFYQSTNFLIVSPQNDYRDSFIYIGKRIEKQFKNYRFVPFFICKQIIDSLSLELKENNATVFHAIFNSNVNVDVNTIGEESYQSSQWLIN